MNLVKQHPGTMPKAEHSVLLDRLPDSFAVPPGLQERLRYDPAQKRLAFDGYMCKATYDRLRVICHDCAYQRALERLFQMAVPEVASPPHRASRLLLATGLLTLALLACVMFVLHR